jgi:hypothetical protein
VRTCRDSFFRTLVSRRSTLVEEATKIALHPRAVAGVSQFGEILDSDHSELGNFRKGMNSDWRSE